MKRKCVICGTEFETGGSSRATCSDECKQENTKRSQRKAYLRRKLQETNDITEINRITKMLSLPSGYICANCGKQFETSTCEKKSVRYCSDDCRIKRSKILAARRHSKEHLDKKIAREAKKRAALEAKRAHQEEKAKKEMTINQKIAQLEMELKALQEKRIAKKTVPEYFLKRGNIYSKLRTGESVFVVGSF